MEPLDSLIIFNTDSHLSEYPCENERYIQTISNFTGSNATLLLSTKGNYLFTDGRYYTQAKNQLPENIQLVKMEETKLTDKIKELQLKRIGLDLRTVDIATMTTLKKKLDAEIILDNKAEKTEATKLPQLESFLALQENNFADTKIVNYELFKPTTQKFKPVYSIEKNVPLSFLGNKSQLEIFEDFVGEKNLKQKIENKILTGESFDKKLENLFSKTEKNFLLSDLGEIAYIFNLRGDDFLEAPYFFSYAYLENNNKNNNKNKIYLFLRESHEFLQKYFDENSKNKKFEVFIEKYENFDDFFDKLDKKTILTSNSNYKLGANTEQTDILKKTMTRKNLSELAGYFQSGIDDGVVLIKLFNFLHKKRKKIFYGKKGGGKTFRTQKVEQKFC